MSDAEGINDIWRKYIEKVLNVEDEWDGEVGCPEIMGPCCLISEEEVAAVTKEIQIGKSAGPTGVVSETMEASGGVGTKWIDLINTLSKKAVFQMLGERVPGACVQIQIPFLTAQSTQIKSVISVPIKDFIHHYPRALFNDIPRVGAHFYDIPGSGRTFTTYPGRGAI